MVGLPYSFFVQWHLTERCNLKCRHCYQQKQSAEMSYAEICQVIDDIKDTVQSWGIEYGMEISPSFHFTGGEPLLRKDLFAVLEYGKSSGFTLSLLSNGTLITDDIALRIREAGISDIQVSLDGLETVHDHIRGKGSFEGAVKGIKNLVSHKIDTNINLTVSKLNIDQIEGLIRFAQQLGLNAIGISRLVPCGRGETLAGEMLSPQVLADLYQSFTLSRGDNTQVSCRDPLASITEMSFNEVPDTDFPVSGCAAGVFGITICADGTVMPCRRMNLPIGNVRNTSFRELWAESPVLWSLRRRKSYHGRCGSCHYWAVCRGCRAVALAVSRASGKDDYLGADPQCMFYRRREAGKSSIR